MPMHVENCDGMPTMMGCPASLATTRKITKPGRKKSRWLVMYGLIGNNVEDKDTLVFFCPSCAEIVIAHEAQNA